MEEGWKRPKDLIKGGTETDFREFLMDIDSLRKPLKWGFFFVESEFKAFIKQGVDYFQDDVPFEEFYKKLVASGVLYKENPLGIKEKEIIPENKFYVFLGFSKALIEEIGTLRFVEMNGELYSYDLDG